MKSQPLVSIVTPSYEMGGFLRDTIESVLTQDYPNIEYIVQDAGSTDNTLDILRQYEGRLTYESTPDHGPAEAINRALARSRGSIVAYLNADDTYLPGAVSTAVQRLNESPESAVVYGNGYWVDGNGLTLGVYPTEKFDSEIFRTRCFICQPASFMRRAAFEAVGMMNVKLQYTFDYDLWIRMARHYQMEQIPEFLATSRMHKDNKTLGRRRQVLAETLGMLRGHYQYVPFALVHAYCAHLLDRRDGFFEPLQPSMAKYVLSLFIGLRHNFQSPLRFVKEWASVMTYEGFVRRCQALIGK